MLLRLCSILSPAAVLAACGGERASVRSESPSDTSSPEAASPATSPTEVSDGALPFGLQRCPSELTFVSAPDSWYRDEPVYVENEMPIEEMRTWARGQPGFEDIWIDRDRNGWISVAFSVGADERQAEPAEATGCTPVSSRCGLASSSRSGSSRLRPSRVPGSA